MTTRSRIIFAAFLTALGAVVFLTTMVHALYYAPEVEAPVAEEIKRAASQNMPGEYPDQLEIPVLNIHTHVLSVGIAKSGNMAVPPTYTDVGWYKYGTVPGSVGSAVIDGHVDNGFALDGVFKHLNNLKVGDDVYIETKDGKRLHFVVSDIEIYDKDAVPTDLLFNRKDTSRLNLITCDGAWVAGEKTYDHRLVVYTTLIS